MAQGKRRISFSNQFSYVGAEAADNERDNYVVRDKNDAAIMLFNDRAIYKYKCMYVSLLQEIAATTENCEVALSPIAHTGASVMLWFSPRTFPAVAAQYSACC